MNTSSMKDNRSPRRTGDIKLHARNDVLWPKIDQSIVGPRDDAKTMIVCRDISQVVYEGDVIDLHTPVIVPDQVPVPAFEVSDLRGRIANNDFELLKCDLLTDQTRSAPSVMGFSMVKSKSDMKDNAVMVSINDSSNLTHSFGYFSR